MKVVIFGATGSVGQHLVKQSVGAGYETSVFMRRKHDDGGSDATVTRHYGDVLNAADVEAAVAGKDAVICALGDGAKGAIRAAGTANIIAAMQSQGVRRLICQSTLGAGDSRPALNFFWKYVMFGVLLRKAMADHEAQENLVRRSGLDWTIVRPAAFTDDPVGGQYRHGFAPRERGLTMKIGRADVARFILAQLGSERYLRAAPSLSL